MFHTILLFIYFNLNTLLIIIIYFSLLLLCFCAFFFVYKHLCKSECTYDASVHKAI